MEQPPVTNAHNASESPRDRRTQGDEFNPFEPPSGDVAPALVANEALGAGFWAGVIVVLILFILLSIVVPGLGVPATIALVGAAIRVPLVRRQMLRSPQRTALVALPSPTRSILVSWLLMLAIGIASIVAFCTICIPLGFLMFNTNASSGGIVVLLSGSGLVGLGTFIFLFRQTLKIPV